MEIKVSRLNYIVGLMIFLVYNFEIGAKLMYPELNLIEE